MNKVKQLNQHYKDLRHAYGVEVATAMVFRSIRKKYFKFTSFSKSQPNAPVGKLPNVDNIFYSRFPNLTPILPALPKLNSERKINLMALSINGKHIFGGTATALVFAMKLSIQMNIKLRLVCTDYPGTLDNIEEFLKEYDINFDLKNLELFNAAPRSIYSPVHLEVRKDDIFIATTWWSAYLCEKLQPSTKFIYFVQDYEPIFSPNGDEQILANGSYLLKDRFIPIVNTKILLDYFVQNNYEEFKKYNLSFEPSFLKSIFDIKNKKTVKQKKKKLFFYARPNVARNMYYLGLQALVKAFEDNILDLNEWEIFFAGGETPELEIVKKLNSKNLGKMNLREYGKFAANVDLAISLMMAPHPSYPPLEMAASGAIVVTTLYENKVDLSMYSKNILVAEYTIDSILSKIKEALRIDEKTRQINFQQNNILSNWDESFKNTIPYILKLYNNANY